MKYTDFEPMLIVLATVGVVFVVVYGLSIRNTIKTRRELPERRQDIINLLKNALGDFPVPELSWPPLRLLSIVRFMVVSALVIAVPCLLLYVLALSVASNLWPGQRESLLLRSALSLLALAVCFFGILPLCARLILFSSRDQAMPKWLTTLWQTIVFAQILEMLAIVVAPVALAFFDSPAFPYGLTFLGYLAALVIALVARSTTLISAGRPVQKGIEQGNYEIALQRARFDDLRFSHAIGTLYNIGTVLLFAGRAEKADPVFRQAVAQMLKTGQLTPILLANFGYALLRQDRFEEARKLFEGLTQLYPTQGHAYAGLAEVYLFQGIEPASALNTTERFFDDKTLQQRRENKGHLLASLLADAAWAQAMLGRHSDAQGTLNLAFQRAFKKFKPGLAGLYYKAGQVMRLSGDRGKAVAYFEQSRAIDPQGAYGAFATKALAEMQSSASS